MFSRCSLNLPKNRRNLFFLSKGGKKFEEKNSQKIVFVVGHKVPQLVKNVLEVRNLK